MQPVLARAQTMLSRPKEFSIEDLERIAAEVEANYLNAEAYLDSDAVNLKPADPPVSRADIMAALETLRPEFGLQVNHNAGSAALSIKGLSGKSPRFAMSDQALDADMAARPLTALSPEVAQLADQLTRPGETLPLVIGSYRTGAFRRSCAFWVTEDGMEPLASFAGLLDRFDAWDGKLPAPEKITAAAQHAQKEAEKQVRAIETRARNVEQANLAAQREAAALRLSREVARLLRCLDPTAADLAQLAEAQAARPGPLAERIRQAKQRLGGKFAWTEQTRWELQEFLKDLTPNDKQSRLSGSSLDAAFADYRWTQPPAGTATAHPTPPAAHTAWR